MMKMMFKLIFPVLLLVTVSQSKEYKAIFDCSSDNAYYIKTRMWLVGKTMDMIEKKGDNATFVLTLHGGCVPMVSKEFKDIVDANDVDNITKAQMYLSDLSKRKGTKIIVCAMSLNANAIDQKEVLPFIAISENSFIDTIGYQNDGYALMSFK